MFLLVLVWCSSVTLADPLDQEPMLSISRGLSSQFNTASWTSGTYVSKRNTYTIKFGNLSTILSPKFDRYEILIRLLDTTLELPSVHYRKNNRLNELTVEPDGTDAYLERVGLSRDIVQGLSKGLDLRVSSINLDTSDITTPLLVGYGQDEEKVDWEEFLWSEDSKDEGSRGKRDVETNMVDSEDVRNYPCHRRSLWTRKRGDLHPSSFDIGQCVGSCSYNLIQQSKSSSNHTKMQAALGKSRPGDTQVPHCCVPVKFETQWFMNVRDRFIRRREMQNAVVTECGCR